MILKRRLVDSAGQELPGRHGSEQVSPDPHGRRSLHRSLLLAGVLFCSYAYFYQAGGWNQNAHFALVRALVEQQVLYIDAYASSTGDTSTAGPHTYSAKAPGAAMLAAPAVAIVRAALQVAGFDRSDERVIVALSYVATLTAAALPATIGAWCLFWLSRLLGADDTGAAVTMLAFGLGTPSWAYATLLYSHALAGACLLAACLAAALIKTSRPENRWKLAIVTGLSAGWAVLTEFPALFPAMFVSALALISSWQGNWSMPTRVALGVVAGAAGPAFLLVSFNWLAFGSPFHVSYATVNGFDLMHEGFFGITFPGPRRAYQILFGQWRGLLPLAPVLALAPLGFWWLLRKAPSRPVALVAGATVTAYFWVTTSYAYWWGGACYGPRLLGASLAFWALGLGPLWMHSTRFWRVLILALTLAGTLTSVIAVSTTPQPPEAYRRPVTQLLWPLFLNDRLGANWESVLDSNPGNLEAHIESNSPPAAWNIGQLLGLSGRMSLLPLAAIWVFAIALWLRWQLRATSARAV